MTLYWTSIEYKYLPGSSKHGQCKGGIVYAFVSAHDVRDTLKKFEQEMNSLNLEISCIEFVSPYENIPWDTPKEEKKYKQLAKEASETGDVICDDFYAYEDD